MAGTKIHCDLWEIFGPDWANLPDEQIEALANAVNTMELLGDEPNRRGFVGTRRNNTMVGGYFAVQHVEQELHYIDRDQLERKDTQPFQRLFFVFIPRTGKLLLQNPKFVNISLKIEKCRALFREALDIEFGRVGVGKLIDFTAPPKETPPQDFILEFEQSDRVIRLQADYPDPNRIPEEFVYYNPQVERNMIIRASHQNDYKNFKRVDIEATPSGDLRQTHIAKDLVKAGIVQLLAYIRNNVEKTLRRETRRNFEFRVDMDADYLPVEDLEAVIELLRKEGAIDIPTPAQKREDQISLFDLHDEDYDDEN